MSKYIRKEMNIIFLIFLAPFIWTTVKCVLTIAHSNHLVYFYYQAVFFEWILMIKIVATMYYQLAIC
jgi:hypothetical protein